MIDRHRHAVGVERRADLLDTLARAAVDDHDAVARQVVGDRGAERGGLVGRLLHLPRQVRPVEPFDEPLQPLQPELRDDILLHVRRRRRGQRDDGGTADRLDRFLQPEVARAEIVAPLRDAVRLVDGEEGDVDAGHHLQELRALEALRRDVEEAVLPCAQIGDPLPRLAEVERRVDGGGADVARVERVDLILHQRDERRDDDGDAGQQKRRDLIAERLAAAGRHHDERVAAAEDRVDDLLLPEPECVVPEIALQNGQWCGR
jgi:hypothetical protein